MVLSGVEGPDQTLKLPLNMDTQFRRLAALVRDDPDLGPRMPDMVALLQRVQARLEREPMVVTLTDPETGNTYDTPVGRHFLDYIIRRDIGDASDLPVFPRLLYSIDQGDPRVLGWFVQKRAGMLLVVDGMSAVMDIASGATPARRRLVASQAEQSMFRDAANYPMPLWDDAWQAPDLGDDYRSPLISDVHTLLLSGTLDWNTPPFQAEQLRWGMTDATHLVVRNAGHEQVLTHPEIWKAVRDFLRGEDVSDVEAAWPAIEWVPLEGYDPERTHPSVPRP
jgi:pimeloyl-ACP methyl ester carboxylesterase